MKRAKKPPKKEAEPRWQTHVYLGEADYRALKETAERESRSLTLQIQHYIRQGMARAKP